MKKTKVRIGGVTVALGNEVEISVGRTIIKGILVGFDERLYTFTLLTDNEVIVIPYKAVKIIRIPQGATDVGKHDQKG